MVTLSQPTAPEVPEPPSADGATGVVLWHREHLRTQDHRGIATAADSEALLPLFVFDPAFYDGSGLACDARIRFLHECLEDLDDTYRSLTGTGLTYGYGDPVEILSRFQDAGWDLVAMASPTGRYGKRRDKRAAECGVTFVDGAPDKADYRRKKLTDRNDDYANMRALVRWRAERAVGSKSGGMARDDRPDPDLLVIDGGEGQLEAARDALAETGWDVPVVALAKARELVVTPSCGSVSGANGAPTRAERSVDVHDWDADAPQLHLLQRVRDEAHRFAVQYHQTVRDEVSTTLDDVPGIGPALRERLLRRFGSVDGVREASVSELRQVEGVGDATAEIIASRL
jgi:hypothetical protein